MFSKEKDKHGVGICHPSLTSFFICLLGLVVTAVLVAGCASRPKPSIPEGPVTVSAREAADAICNLGHEIRSIELHGKLKMVQPEDETPWINCTIRFTYGEKGDRDLSSATLMMRGTGPFGTSLFQVVSMQGNTEIRLPRNGEVYHGRFFSILEQRFDAERFKVLLGFALNPWLLLCHGYENGVSCRPDALCYSGLLDSKGFKAIFSNPGFLPILVQSKEFQVAYDDELMLINDQKESKRGTIRYPSRITLFVPSWGLTFKFMVKPSSRFFTTCEGLD